MDTQLTRREWMLAAACWGEILSAQQTLTFFDPAPAAEIEAIAAQIIPDDDTPGARQTGVIRFIDRALAGFDQDKRDAYRKGLADTQARRAQMFPGSTSIASLTVEQQFKLAETIEKTEFFRLVRAHTILGFLGHPMHGGNRGEAGWKLIGFPNAMHYQPPFGYYDEEAARGGGK